MGSLLLQKVGGSSISYGPYTLAFSAVVASRGGVVTDSEKGYLTTFENSMGSDLSEFDRLFIYGLSNNIAARTSFVNPSSAAATAINNPTFTPSFGYQSNLTTSYIDTNFNQLNNAVKYQQNSASYGYYVRISQGNNLTIPLGLFQNSPLNTSYNMPNFNNFYYYNCNNTSDTNGAGLVTKGFFSSQRRNSTLILGYKDGVQLYNGFNISTPLVDKNFYSLCCNANGTPLYFSDNQQTLVFFGSGAINQLNFYNAVQALGTSIGWAV